MEVMLRHLTVFVYHFDEYSRNSMFVSGVLHWVATYLLPFG